mgnify:CR=1 FL=1
MLLKNKKILISGLANKYSIASGIASAMHREGAELAFTYQNERLLKKLKPLAKEYGSNILIECDVSSDDSIKNSFVELKKRWSPLRWLHIHSSFWASFLLHASRPALQLCGTARCGAGRIAS